jgi:hypothetical protein
LEAARPRLFKAGLVTLAIVAPLLVTPFTSRPFTEGKLLATCIGALLVWLSRPPLGHDRWLLWLSVAWVGVAAVSAAINPDPLQSVSGTPWQATGVVTIAVCAYLLVAATGFPAWVLGRLPVWFVWTAITMVAVLAFNRFFPSVPHRLLPSYADLTGSTMGLTVFADAMFAVGLASAMALDRWRLRWQVAALVAISFGFALTNEVSSWMLPLIVIVATFVKLRPELRRATLLAVSVAAVVALGVLIPPPSNGYGGTTATIAQVRSTAGETYRFTVWSTDVRAALDRPVLGWGSGNAWGAYLHAATLADFEAAGDNWGDAHDIFIEMLVTTGLLGLLVFVALIAKVLIGVIRSPRSTAWVFGALAGLAFYSLIEPVHVLITPLAFMLAGIAIGPAEVPEAEAADPVRSDVGRWSVGVAAVACVVVSGIVFAAGWADGPSVAQARRAAAIQPWRNDAVEREAAMLAGQALSAKSNSTAEDAMRLASELVTAHPWDPFAWYAAIQVAETLGDRPSVAIYVTDAARRFPAFFSAEHMATMGLASTTPSRSP